MATTIIGSIFILIMGLISSPLIFIFWGFALIRRLIRGIGKGLDKRAARRERIREDRYQLELYKAYNS